MSRGNASLKASFGFEKSVLKFLLFFDPGAFDDRTPRNFPLDCNSPLSSIYSGGKAKEEVTSAGGGDDLVLKPHLHAALFWGHPLRSNLQLPRDFPKIQFDPSLAQN